MWKFYHSWDGSVRGSIGNTLAALPQCRGCSATVSGESFVICHWALGLGKATKGNDPRPGELPFAESPASVADHDIAQKVTALEGKGVLIVLHDPSLAIRFATA